MCLLLEIPTERVLLDNIPTSGHVFCTDMFANYMTAREQGLLRPGDRYFTALLEEGETFVRQDFSAEAWQGPPSAAFSFWTGRVPSTKSQ